MSPLILAAIVFITIAIAYAYSTCMLNDYLPDSMDRTCVAKSGMYNGSRPENMDGLEMQYYPVRHLYNKSLDGPFMSSRGQPLLKRSKRTGMHYNPNTWS